MYTEKGVSVMKCMARCENNVSDNRRQGRDMVVDWWSCSMFFFQAEDGIRDLVRSRGLGDVYKRQVLRNALA